MFGRQVSDAFKRVLDSRRFAHGSCCHVLLHIKDVEAGMVSAREVKPCLLGSVAMLAGDAGGAEDVCRLARKRPAGQTWPDLICILSPSFSSLQEVTELGCLQKDHVECS